ncbi:MAG: 2-dehydro-3-deoxyphosphogluconate aldolase, partial [Pseudoflavonifractor sp.]
MENLKELIYHFGLLPVVKLDQVENAIPLAQALCDGGLAAAEITFRTDCAAEAIKAITTRFPDMLVGAGTVVSVEQVQLAVAAGA